MILTQIDWIDLGGGDVTQGPKHWRDLLRGFPARGEGAFPIAAYSEFMPAPRIGLKPYGTWTFDQLSESRPLSWRVTAREELQFLRPGLTNIATQLLNDLVAVARGKPSHHIGVAHLTDNPYWPPTLADGVGSLNREPFLILSPVALSRTQDDKGRVRWALFGGSHEGPSQGFWDSFRSPDEQPLSPKLGRAMLAAVLSQAFSIPSAALSDLGRAGLRYLPEMTDPEFPFWTEGQVPSWIKELEIGEAAELSGVRFVLTFRPFAKLPKAIQLAYLSGRINLAPYPGSLVFWGSRHYRSLDRTLPYAIQIPLLQCISRHSGVAGIRVPQSGWMFEPGKGAKGAREHSERLGPLRNDFRRSHRWQRIERDDADTDKSARIQGIQRVLFSAHPDDVSLYDKPMARNSQIWSDTFEALFDGPRAGEAELEPMLKLLQGGGSFGYRMYYPPMTIGRSPVYWHRPLIAFRGSKNGPTRTAVEDLTGYLTAGPATDRAAQLRFYPEFDPLTNIDPPPPPRKPAAAIARTHCELNIRKLADARKRLAKVKLPVSFARSLLTTDKDFDFEGWLDRAVRLSEDAPNLSAELAKIAKTISRDELKTTEALTFGKTATRDFEVNYWNTIAFLSAGDYLTKNNADVVVDPVTLKHRPRRSRDLDPLGDYLIGYYRKLIAGSGLQSRAVAGEHRFQWRTDFDFRWMGGWTANQQGDPAERNIVCVIPGKNRKEAVVFGDHYDTAYMEDVYGYGEYKGDHARVAAAGADDNNSATATLMLAAPILLELSSRGELACDVWLVHLTGEEFPSDCLGARNLSQSLIEGSFRVGLEDGKTADLSATRVRGLFVMDMIAHNNDKSRDIFQIAPGTDPQSMWLAFQAQRASELWKLGATEWNQTPARKKSKRGKRSADPTIVPALAKHLAPRGQVRPHYDPKSTLFNTDGQVFSDAGVPVVLFMENYDIERQGYHDTHDTMENIDLDYGAAVSAICIESVARAANQILPDFEAIRLKAMR